MFEQSLYSRGFCFFPVGTASSPRHFREVVFRGWVLALHKDIDCAVAQAEKSDSFVALVGYGMDINRGHDDQARIAEALLSALEKSERNFFQLISDISGRYCILYSLGGRVSVIGDACATKALFYAKDRPYCASHFQMVVEAAGLGPSRQKLARDKDKRRRSCYGYAAGETPDSNVALLLANMVLRVPSMLTERFYPFESLQTLDVESAASELLRLFRLQIKILADRYKLFVSLTAGLDSRVTLAACVGSEGVRTFSYLTQAGHLMDAALASDIAERLGFDHEIISSVQTKSREFSEFIEVLNNNNYHRHNVVAAYGYLSLFCKGSIHIRSNLFEIGRAFYRSQRDRPVSLTAAGMAALYYRGFSEAEDADLVEDFQRYIDNSCLDQATHGYDLYDIFYWEQRMSSWHSMVLLEADPSVDTFLLFNSRRCIELALAVDLGRRCRGDVFCEIVRRADPQLLSFPINPKEYPVPADLAAAVPESKPL